MLQLISILNPPPFLLIFLFSTILRCRPNPQPSRQVAAPVAPVPLWDYELYNSITTFVPLTPALDFFSASWTNSNPFPTTVGSGRHCSLPAFNAGVT